MIKFYLDSVTSNTSKYVSDLQKLNLCIDTLVSDDGYIYYVVNINTVEDILKINRIVFCGITIQNFRERHMEELFSKYPNYEFPKYEIIIHDGYMR